MTPTAEIKMRIDRLVSDLSCCDRDGCRCWQAVDYLKQIREYAETEFEKHADRVGMKQSGGVRDKDD